MELMIIMNNEMEREFLTHFYALSSDNQAYILALEQALLSKEQAGGNKGLSQEERTLFSLKR